MLELKNISLSVEDEFTDGSCKEILRDVSLKLDSGKFIVITGPNGGGKSTMAKMIAGILKPNQGQILLDGEDITELNITERARRGISFAFQQPVRFKGITVRDLINLAAGHEISDCEACEYLRQVGLCAKDYIDREVNASLSGGEIKRIEIATVMARGTRLWRAAPDCPSLTSRRQASTCGALTTSSMCSAVCEAKSTAPSLSSPIRSAFWILRTKSLCWLTAKSAPGAPRTRSCPSCSRMTVSIVPAA